ncbi:hypothetical protein ST201phi2-1p182 [Pseudomonas phage 201phi2-1]|uniref:Uncharacterized protein n=1 Tax=Pseudomonas phage 201phi2-1 TaxID=198110 RepID=B3FJ45_BP201|nr:hypothetical protein ST201phi2-1p182 [Pseudomonas phage 201phi2-1]ABY63012.1 hypothetical protein 201phi2-1p182 [Pseudomonas phage 201phi2-1]
MTNVNMSTIGGIYVLASEGLYGTEYWTGGNDWSCDINNATQLGTGGAMHWIAKLTGRAVKVKAVEIDGTIDVMHWPDIGWVVVNHREWPVTVHRLYMVGNYGEGWFFENEGTVERKLCRNLGNGTYHDITVRGKEITGSTLRSEGEAFENFTAFNIPNKSNLVYQFEFDPKPVEF